MTGLAPKARLVAMVAFAASAPGPVTFINLDNSLPARAAALDG